MSAGAPTLSSPPGTPSSFAGLALIFSMSWLSVMWPSLTSLVLLTQNAVSKPLMPLAAMWNSTRFSSSWCGAWSVAIASSVPSTRPAMQASRSLSSRSGGLTRQLLS